MKKRLLLLLCLTLTAGGAAWAEIASGTCKRGTWVIDDNGKLTVNIDGDMADYGEGKAPWYGYRSKITAIHISSGCTNIGRNGFFGLERVEKVTGGENVEACAMYSFEDCGSSSNPIPSIYFPKCSYVGERAFRETSAVFVSLPLVETYKADAIYSYHVDDRFINFIDLGSKVKKLRPGSMCGPDYVFIQSPTPPEWVRLYHDEEWDGPGGGKPYRYPFGSNPNVKVIVPQEYLQTYIDYYPSEHPEVCEGYMCAYFDSYVSGRYVGFHPDNQDIYSTGKLVAGAPIYKDGEFIGFWYIDDGELTLEFLSGIMPTYSKDNAPWKSVLDKANKIVFYCNNKDFIIPANAFEGINSSHITFKDMKSITIGDGAFKNCTNLEDVYFSHGGNSPYISVYIGNSAFQGCKNLEILEEGGLYRRLILEKLGVSCFEGCEKLQSIGINKMGIRQEVPERAFYGCKDFKKWPFMFRENALKIGKQAFYGAGLDEVNMKKPISIEEQAFANSDIEKVILGNLYYTTVKSEARLLPTAQN